MKRFIHNHITSKPLWYNMLVALILAMLLLLIFILSLKWMTNHGVARNVPSVTGKNLNEVLPMLEKEGFEVVIQDSVYYDSLPPLAIIRQVPEADAVVKVNRTIYVTINRVIPPDVAMPNLVGYSIRNAEMTLRNMGLKLGDTTFKPYFARNSVLEQLYNGNPVAAGTMIKVGSRISLVLGSGVGTEDMSVPDLVGMNFAEAKILLEAQGLILGSILPDPTVKDQETAFVVRTDPSRFDSRGRPFRIRAGQMIHLFLSANPPVRDTVPAPLTPVPNPPEEEEQ